MAHACVHRRDLRVSVKTLLEKVAPKKASKLRLVVRLRPGQRQSRRLDYERVDVCTECLQQLPSTPTHAAVPGDATGKTQRRRGVSAWEPSRT